MAMRRRNRTAGAGAKIIAKVIVEVQQARC
jgi:hypothetical protein